DSHTSNSTSRRWTSTADTGSGDRHRRSRSPPSSRRTACRERSPSPSTAAKSPVSAKTGAGESDDVKKLSMKERLSMWKKRKELERGTGSPSLSAAESPAEPPTRPLSRTSSMADESNGSSLFATAPSSITSDHEQKSPTFASASSGEQPAGPASDMDIEKAGVKLKIGAGLGSGAKPLGKFGKIKLGGHVLGARAKRTTLLSRPSPLASSVFGAEADDNETVHGLNGNGAARRLPPLLPELSTDSHSADEVPPVDRHDIEPSLGKNTPSMDVDDGVDPLEEYMQGMESQAKRGAEDPADGGAREGGTATLGASSSDVSAAKQALVEDDVDDMDDADADVEDVLALAARRLKKKEIAAVDHSKMNYENFKRNFYIEPAELRSMDPEEVERMRADLGGIKVRGVDAPKPATSWSYFGLPSACADVIKHQGFERPTPVQAQTVPAILSGRDVIGVAKTGSGKTLAFILPMLRHIKAQRPLAQGDGPIGLVMTPTRELAVQIHRECKPFLRP
ncbi:pre-mRNA processing RNA-helicase, partial [Coemansia sp. RSA 2559]